MQIDPTLIGVIIGGAVGILGPVLTQFVSAWFTDRREDKKWLREQSAEKAKRIREEEQERSRERREIFQDVVNSLSVLISIDHEELPKAEQVRHIEEAVKKVNALALRCHPSDNEKTKAFHTIWQEFIGSPMSNVSEMSEAVTNLATSDSVLFPNARKEIETKTEKLEPGIITFKVDIGDEFRKEELAKAIQVSPTHEFTRRLEELTDSQRALLINIYFPDYKRIPEIVQLPLPSSRPKPDRTHTWGLHWKGYYNPDNTTPEKILEMWERDYNSECEKRLAAETGNSTE
ncbi:MAG: hypothetical protein ACR2LM_11535 [Pyrinomonadaceae bacterium]